MFSPPAPISPRSLQWPLMSNYWIVQTTTESKADAQQIAEQVVAERLVACAQIVGPLTSVYTWKEKVETAEEWLCLLKTTQQGYTALEAKLQEIHPYEEPEIVAVPISQGSPTYLKWLTNSVALPK